MRDIHKNVPVRFQPYAWKVVETDWQKKDAKNNETIFSVANGYLGIRGFFEEGFDGEKQCADRTTMINGVYEYFNYIHVVLRPAFPTRCHAIVPQANAFDVALFVDGEKVDVSKKGKISDYSRTLEFLDGTVCRTFVYTTEKGKKVKFTFTRFASQEDKHLAADKMEIEALDDATVVVATRLEAPQGCLQTPDNLYRETAVFDFLSADKKCGVQTAHYKTRVAPFEIAVAAVDTFDRAEKPVTKKDDLSVTDEYTFALKAGEKVSGARFIAYATNRDFTDYQKAVQEKVKKAAKQGFEKELQVSKKHLDEFWKYSDVEVDDPLVQQGLRFSAFQIYQSTGRDGVTNISANGLSGTVYSGHTFWDTEVFIMPMYLYTHPEMVKPLIMYRYNILDKARERAQQMEDHGALFSWNSINGEECGTIFEAVTAQYHINNDIFYSIYRYFEATQDEAFLVDYCAEILFEVSKCMAHRGSFVPTRNNQFCINVICGPDEYNPIVDNNMYTNVLTQKQLYFTLKVADLLKEKYPAKYAQLLEKCQVDDEEMALWKRAADNMYIPYSKELDMYMQDDNFIYKDPIDIESIPKEKLPLLSHLHPLNLWRCQLCKQADIVLLTFICSEYFTQEQRKKIFEYYEPKTIHDSSLSASIHSIVACDVGDKKEAYGYLMQSARMDLDNVNGNTAHGLHAACMGAAWMMMVNGYAGLRVYGDELNFRPFIHDGWKNYKFTFLFRGSRISVNVCEEHTVYKLLEGAPIKLQHFDEEYLLKDELRLSTEKE